VELRKLLLKDKNSKTLKITKQEDPNKLLGDQNKLNKRNHTFIRNLIVRNYEERPLTILG